MPRDPLFRGFSPPPSPIPLMKREEWRDDKSNRRCSANGYGGSRKFLLGSILSIICLLGGETFFRIESSKVLHEDDRLIVSKYT